MIRLRLTLTGRCTAALSSLDFAINIAYQVTPSLLMALRNMVHPGGFEPPTARFVAEYSIQLSYGCKMAVRRGFEPRMQLLTAYSLSRGAPSASRPPHHTPLTSASKSLFRLIVAAWRTYYFLGLISQTIFPDSASFAHLPPNPPALPTKRLFYQRKCADMTINRSWSKRGKARREKQKKACGGKKIKKGGCASPQ